jgi:cytochrome c
LLSANFDEGKKFSKKCVACHSFEIDGPNKIGPNLYNIQSREIASIESFKYSKALMSKTGKWDNNNLDSFLKKPKEWAPGTKMSYVGIKKGEDRANVIKYLQSLK